MKKLCLNCGSEMKGWCGCHCVERTTEDEENFYVVKGKLLRDKQIDFYNCSLCGALMGAACDVDEGEGLTVIVCPDCIKKVRVVNESK